MDSSNGSVFAALGLTGLMVTLMFGFIYWDDAVFAVLEGPVGKAIFAIEVGLFVLSVGIVAVAKYNGTASEYVPLAGVYIAISWLAFGLAMLRPASEFLAEVFRTYAPSLEPIQWFAVGIGVFGALASLVMCKAGDG